MIQFDLRFIEKRFFVKANLTFLVLLLLFAFLLQAEFVPPMSKARLLFPPRLATDVNES